MKLILFFLLSLLPLLSVPTTGHAEEEQQIVINNRILAQVNGRTISVLDVLKKMEVYLARYYPDTPYSATMRYQFFSSNWRQILSQMIDNELMLADAELVQLKVNDAEIRETLHKRFGPNIMPTLNSLGISYDEAWQMIYSEMATQRMSYYRVHSKALQKIGPSDIKLAYKKYLEQNPPADTLKYQLLAIRSSSEQLGSEIAQKAYHLLKDEGVAFAEIGKALGQVASATIQLSEEYEMSTKDLSEAHKKALLSLKPGTFSAPLAQESRDKSIVHRIFFLKELQHTAAPSFEEMADKLHDELLQKEVDQELPAYLSRLRKRFNVDEKSIETLPTDFHPFSLR
jgi:hypothetical protein